MPDDKYPSELADRFLVRMPDGMRARLAAEAKANGRSMNAEIVARLEVSFTPTSAIGVPLAVASDVGEFAEQLGLPFDDALRMAVAAGTSPDRTPVLYIRARPGMTTDDVHAAIAEARKLMPIGMFHFDRSRDIATPMPAKKGKS